MTARGLKATIVAITGTPGCGKTTVSAELRRHGFPVLDLNRYVGDPRFDEGADADAHGSRIIDEAALSDHLLEHLADELGTAQEPVPGSNDDEAVVFIDSHFSHELAFVDRIVVLRTEPSALRARLQQRDWPSTKVDMNVEAERVSMIRDEALAHQWEAREEGFTIHVVELDTSAADATETANRVLEAARAAPTNLDISTFDWRDSGGA